MRRIPVAALPALAALALTGTACAKKESAAEEKPAAAVVATTAEVTTEKFTETVDGVGSVLARAGHIAQLSAPAPTRVSRVFVMVGAAVTSGDALVEFEQAPFDAAARSADAALSTAEKASARAQRLADAGVLPRKDAESAAAELASAQLTAVTARRARELSTLRAPIAGVVTRMSAVLGASVDATQTLVEVADPSTLDVMLTLSPADAARVKAGAGAALYAGASASGAPVASGRIGDISAAVDSASRGVLVRVAVTDRARELRIGETLFGRIGVGEHANAVVVPIESLVPTGEGFKVFVVDEQGMARAHDVKVGGRTEKGAWITDGVKAGDKVVTKGAYGVDDSTKVLTGKP
jgi:cobalt-zinc-cadmium efflux system membrane fusion protein